MYSQGKFFIDILDRSNNSIISDVLSPVKLTIIDEVGKIPVLEVTYKSSSPVNIRNTVECIIKVHDTEFSALNEYNCGLLSSSTFEDSVIATYLSCPLNCFAIKNTKNLGTKLVNSINNINENLHLNLSGVTDPGIEGNYFQLNMRDIDIFIELCKGVAIDHLVTFRNGEFRLSDINSSTPIGDLGTICGNIDFYNTPYKFNIFNSVENTWKIKTHSYMGYNSFNLYNNEYYKNYFNNLKYYISPSTSYTQLFTRSIQFYPGDNISATLDSMVCNNFIVTKRKVTYENNEVTSELTIGDYTNELRSNK